MKVLAISPTYNERKNVKELIFAIKKEVDDIHVLIIDDNSPDGTADLVKEQQDSLNNIHLIERAGKLGLGTAYITGFKWAIENGYDKIIQIDADMSHDPKDIPRLLEASKDNQLVIGSRYVTGINVVNWPLRRLILSYMANLYARMITGLPIKDATAGYKCFDRSVLESIPFEKIKSEGYSFQIEINFFAWVKKFKIKELPVIFFDRTVGESKMSRKIIIEAVWMVPKLKLKKLFKML